MPTPSGNGAAIGPRLDSRDQARRVPHLGEARRSKRAAVHAQWLQFRRSLSPHCQGRGGAARPVLLHRRRGDRRGFERPLFQELSPRRCAARPPQDDGPSAAIPSTTAYAAAMNFSASPGSASQGKSVRGSSKPLTNAFPTFGLLCAATRMLITCGGGGCSMALVQPVLYCA